MVDLNAAARARDNSRLLLAEIASERERLLTAELKRANQRAERYRSMERDAALYIESPIAMRTHFTGCSPYIGWKGVGLALNEALDERDNLRLAVNHPDASSEELIRNIAENISRTIDRRHDIPEGVSRDLIEIVTAALGPVLCAGKGSAT